MAKLNSEQKSFLLHHEIPVSKVFDATGMRSIEYKSTMSKLDVWIAYGVSPCKAFGHRLRTRAGHCVQCSPENISYLRRHSESGDVYIAYSATRQVVKIGTSIDVIGRIEQLNSYMYGGAFDWELIFSCSVEKAGRLESDVHKSLGKYATDGTYFKNGHLIECRELFNCSKVVAIDALNCARKALK